MPRQRKPSTWVARWPEMESLDLGQRAAETGGTGIQDVQVFTPEPDEPWLALGIGVDIAKLTLEDVEQLITYLTRWARAVRGAPNEGDT